MKLKMFFQNTLFGRPELAMWTGEALNHNVCSEINSIKNVEGLLFENEPIK